MHKDIDIDMDWLYYRDR